MDGATRQACLFPQFPIHSTDLVLDVGCGRGPDSEFAARLGASVIALDVSAAKTRALGATMASICVRPYLVLQSDCDPIPLADESADVVLCKEVLEHVGNPIRVIRELVRVGKPNARYLITVPDPSSESLIGAVAPRWYFQPPFHQHVFDHDALDRMLKSAGLVVERRDSCGAYHSIWWALRFAGDPDFDPRVNPFAPNPSILETWEAMWSQIQATPGGVAFSRRLDQLIPRSQVIVARKAAADIRDESFLGVRRDAWPQTVARD